MMKCTKHYHLKTVYPLKSCRISLMFFGVFSNDFIKHIEQFSIQT